MYNVIHIKKLQRCSDKLQTLTAEREQPFLKHTAVTSSSAISKALVAFQQMGSCKQPTTAPGGVIGFNMNHMHLWHNCLIISSIFQWRNYQAAIVLAGSFIEKPRSGEQVKLLKDDQIFCIHLLSASQAHNKSTASFFTSINNTSLVAHIKQQLQTKAAGYFSWSQRTSD